LAANPDYYILLTTGSAGWYMGTNWLDGFDGGDNSLIINRMTVLKEKAERFEWLYENLADPLSRLSLTAFIKFWLTWDYADWLKYSLYYCDVVDTAVFPFYEGEVFVDCGSFIGDTVLQYAGIVNDRYRRIYTYDISSASIAAMTQNLSALPNIEIRHSGVSDENGEMDMLGSAVPHGGNRLASVTGSVMTQVEKVKVVRLDDDIRERVTFLKIDVEGVDKEALTGAAGIVRKYHPKLNVDAYHQLADIVDVPWLIRELDSSYALYLRLPMLLSSQPRFPFATIMAV
jgi:FkbM family methyltransferase